MYPFSDVPKLYHIENSAVDLLIRELDRQWNKPSFREFEARHTVTLVRRLGEPTSSLQVIFTAVECCLEPLAKRPSCGILRGNPPGRLALVKRTVRTMPGKRMRNSSANTTRSSSKLSGTSKVNASATRVQVKNPITERWVKLDTTTGRIVETKNTPGPYKGVPRR